MEYVWLPTNQIWARIPQASAQLNNKIDASIAKDATESRESLHLEAKQNATCPICLDEILPSTKSLTSPCMHPYCYRCLTTWLNLKRTCPLCKSQVTTVIHTINSDTDFQETILPPQPTQRSPEYDYTSTTRFRTESGSYIPGSHSDPYAYERGTAGRGNDRRRPQETDQRGVSNDNRGPRPYYYRLQRQLATDTVDSSLHTIHHANNTTTSATTNSSSRRPLPLLQPSPPVTTHYEAALNKRRRVYELQLYAQPIQTTTDVGGGALPSTSISRDRRLQEWIDRELEVLLPDTDRTIISTFILGLVQRHLPTTPTPAAVPTTRTNTTTNSNNNTTTTETTTVPRVVPTVSLIPKSKGRYLQQEEAAPREQQQQQQSVLEKARNKVAAVHALLPFLHRNAEQFWHELTSFAASPYSVATYDRLVTHTTKDRSSNSHHAVDIHSSLSPSPPLPHTTNNNNLDKPNGSGDDARHYTIEGVYTYTATDNGGNDRAVRDMIEELYTTTSNANKRMKR